MKTNVLNKMNEFTEGAKSFLRKKRSFHKVGMAPGSLVHVGEKKVEQTTFVHTVYDSRSLERKELASLDAVETSLDPERTNWLVVTGLHDVTLMERIRQMFNIHPLIMEDILHTHQRPKLDIFDDMVYIAGRKSEPATERSQQVSILMNKHLAVTFLEEPDDLFDTIFQRLQNESGRLRRLGTDYLTYALVDVLVDYHLLAMEDLNEYLEQVEEAAIRNPDAQLIPEILRLKKRIMLLQKSVRPMRDVATRLIRDPGPLFSEETRPFLQDLWDHTVQVADSLENAQQVAAAVLDVFYSSVSYRMNEIMKVLTIIATIFIPLSFIVGLYGMNFEYMPELKWRFGYFAVLGLCAGLIIGMLLFFRKRKWF